MRKDIKVGEVFQIGETEYFGEFPKRKDIPCGTGPKKESNLYDVYDEYGVFLGWKLRDNPDKGILTIKPVTIMGTAKT